jgi:hypothetical protein
MLLHKLLHKPAFSLYRVLSSNSPRQPCRILILVSQLGYIFLTTTKFIKAQKHTIPPIISPCSIAPSYGSTDPQGTQANAFLDLANLQGRNPYPHHAPTVLVAPSVMYAECNTAAG